MNLPIWNIGGGIKHFLNLNDYFVNKKIFYDTSHKMYDYVYDSIFGLKWNGGRVCMPQDTCTIRELLRRIESYNNLGVGFNWSFTNLLLTKEDLSDEYCNLLLEATNNSLNGVILTSIDLRNYIKEKYPKLKIIYSVCNGLKKIEDYNRALNENDIVVLHPDFNHNYNYLEQLSKLDGKDRLEVMVNDVCAFGCPFREQHYRNLSYFNKIQSICPIIHDEAELDYGRNNCLAIMNGYTKDERNRLTFSDIDYMLDLGFKYFKIIGREHEWDYYIDRDLIPNLEEYWIRKVIKAQGQGLHI